MRRPDAVPVLDMPDDEATARPVRETPLLPPFGAQRDAGPMRSTADLATIPANAWMRDRAKLPMRPPGK